MLLKSSSDTTMHVNAQVRKHRKQSHSSEVCSAPPYSPDLAPSDLHIVGAAKVVFCEKRFGSADDVIEEVKNGLRI
jgi:hypothetical protein